MLRTAFYQFHLDHGGKMVDFAGWELPIMFKSIHEEHHQVRNSGGMFDVSHMGRIKISGRHARRLLERLLTRYISDMPENACRYSLICNAQGGTIDDVILYRFNEHWLLICNASNRKAVLDHINAIKDTFVVTIEDQTESTAMVALQGPHVMEYIGKFSREVPTLKRYTFCQKNVVILKMVISRTGYTGEDGVEVILPSSMAAMALKLLVKEAKPGETAVVQPTGLGARDTLRMEAAMPLYGHELDLTIDPLTAGLAFAVTLNKDEMENSEKFIGQDALKAIAAAGLKRQRVGLKLEGKRTPRQGMAVLNGSETIGNVTSGCLSPTLGYPIAMAYVPVANAAVGTRLAVALGSENVAAEVVPMPFYSRKK
jgi:aminomethyltransferase